MKKAYKLIFSLILALCVGTGLGLFNTSKAYAEVVDPSEYTSVEKEYLNDHGNLDPSDDEWAPKANAPKFQNGNAIFLSKEQRVSVKLGGGEYVGKIASLTYKITANNLTFDNQASGALEMYGLSIPNLGGVVAFELVIDPEVATANGGSFNYGKYTIEFSYYYIDENLEYTEQTTSVNMYILSYDNYFNNTKYTNLSADLSLSKFFSDYTKTNLPYLYYKYQYFNLKIVRSFKGLSTTTNLTYVGGNLVLTSLNENNVATAVHNISVKTNEQDKTATVIFNDLGVYYLTYQPINASGNNEAITSFYEEVPVLNQNVYVYGYQAYFTTQNGLEEFKMPNSEAPHIIDGTAFSADVTSKIPTGTFNIKDIVAYEDIAKTNQAPIYFETNATMVDDGSVASSYVYYETQNDYENGNATKTVSDYTGTPLSKAGVYFVIFAYIRK